MVKCKPSADDGLFVHCQGRLYSISKVASRISGILPQGGVGAFGHLEIEPKPLEELTIMDQGIRQMGVSNFPNSDFPFAPNFYSSRTYQCPTISDSLVQDGLAETDPILSWASGRVVRQRFQGDRVWKGILPTLDMVVGREVMSPRKMGSIEMTTFQTHTSGLG